MRALCALLCVAPAFAACKVPAFDIQLTEQGEFPDIAPTNGMDFPSVTNNASLEESFSNNGVKSNEIASAEITAASLSVIASDANDLARISELDVQVAADGLPTITVVTGTAADFAAKPESGVVELQIPSEALKAYVVASSVTVTPHITFTGPPAPTAIPFTLNMTLHVQGQIP